MLAPLCLFTYNRLFETQQTISALQNNFLAPESELIIYSDGGKDGASWLKVNAVREYLKTISGFKSIRIIEYPENKGLANSIISGVTMILEEYGKIIVLEDDLLTSRNFLDFMNQALDFYENNITIQSVTGYTLNLKALKTYPLDYYYGYRESSWGWGTWFNRWDTADWEVKRYSKFNIFQQIKFMRGGSDLPLMLKRQMEGKIDSWAIRWCFDQFIKEQLTVFPSVSKIINIGSGTNATHTKLITRYITNLDNSDKRYFIFNERIEINRKIVKQFRYKFSFKARIIDKIKLYKLKKHLYGINTNFKTNHYE